jgi:hypothetical protein
VRYCYTGNYLDPAADLQSGPVLLLPHVETYKISEDFDVPELQREYCVLYEADVY